MKIIKVTIMFFLMIIITSCGKNPLITILNNEQQFILIENFETYSPGNFTDGIGGWKILSENGVVTISNTIYRTGNKSLSVVNSSSSTLFILKREFIVSKDIIFMEGYMLVLDEGFGAAIGLTVGQSGDLPLSNLAILVSNCLAVDGKRKFAVAYYKKGGMPDNKYGGEYGTVVSDVQIFNNRWYKVKIKLDTGNKQWEIWIDDNKPNVGGSGNYDTLSGFATSVIVAGYTGDAYFDDIKVTE